MTTFRFVAGVVTLSVLLEGCSCGETVRRTFPRIELLDEMGAERLSLDFGSVQLNATATTRLRIRNAGNAALNITQATFSNMKFGNGETLPVTLPPNGETMFAFTFKPTEPDLREQGTVTLTSDDPSRGTVQIQLFGTGIAAVATVMPRTLDFGEVYLGESRSLDLTVSNAGSNTLELTAATQAPASVPGLTGDLTPLVTTLAPGASARASLRYAPTAIGDLTAAITITPGGGLDPLRVTVRGKAIEAVPRLCFRFDETPMESCTDRTMTSLQVPFGALCDNRLFPPDAGRACVTLDGGTALSARSGRLYVRNEGNTPVSYALNVNVLAGGRCDGGTGIDFAFSNSPAADAGRFSTPSTQLPAQVTDPKPWESTPVTVTYRPTSQCRDDGADQVQLFWLRQGEPVGTSRMPQSFTAVLTGQSLLPRGVPFDLNIMLGGQVTNATQPYQGLSNIGDAPLTIRSATFWQGELFIDGGIGAVPFEECSGDPFQAGACPFFKWGVAPTLPTTLAGTPNPMMPVNRAVGQIFFGQQDGGPAPQAGVVFRAFAVFETDDPYGAPCPFPSMGTCVVSQLRASR